MKNVTHRVTFLFWRAQKDSLARHKRVGCGATVTICRHRRLANLLVVEPEGSNPGLAQKLNRRSRRLKFWRAQKDSNPQPSDP